MNSMGMNSSAWENFLNAAQLLVTAGPVKQRLAQAYTAHLSRLTGDEIPREYRDEFAAIGARLESVQPLRGETAVQASVRKMSDFEAAAYAVRIVDLLGAMIRSQLQPRQPVLRAVGDD